MIGARAIMVKEKLGNHSSPWQTAGMVDQRRVEGGEGVINFEPCE